MESSSVSEQVLSNFLKTNKIKPPEKYTDESLNNIINLILSRDFYDRDVKGKDEFVTRLICLILHSPQFDQSTILYTLGKYMMDKIKLIPEKEKLDLLADLVIYS